MQIPIQASGVARINPYNSKLDVRVTPSRDCRRCKTVRVFGRKVERCWNDPICISEQSACRTACRSAQGAAMTACLKLTDPTTIVACEAAALQAGNECYNGC